MVKKYVVRLTAEERRFLRAFVRKGKVSAYKAKHANILLKIDAHGPAWTDEQAAEAFDCHVNTPRNIRQRFVLEGLESALSRKKQQHPSRQRVLDGEGEAKLIAIACGPAPKGRSRWSLRLLAGRLVELEVVEGISRETVRQVLKKTSSSLTCASAG